MKAITYVKKIEKENACSIHTAEMLTKSLQREGILSESFAIRFRPLFGDFDIVNADFMVVGVKESTPTNLDEMKRAIEYYSEF